MTRSSRRRTGWIPRATPLRSRATKPRSKIQGTLAGVPDDERQGRRRQTSPAPPGSSRTPRALRPICGAHNHPAPWSSGLREASEDIDRAQPRRRLVAANLEATAARRSRPSSQESIVPAAPVPTPEPVAPKVAAPPVVSALLSVAGLSPFGAGTSPVAPAQSPALWAMMAWTRREFERSINPLSSRVISAKDAASVVAEGEIQPMAAVGPNAAMQTDDLTPKPQVPASLAGLPPQRSGG